MQNLAGSYSVCVTLGVGDRRVLTIVPKLI